MKGLWLVVGLSIACLGCAGKPKREMKSEAVEEIPSIPANQYTMPRDDLPRDQLLIPKGNAPVLNSNPAMPNPGAPGTMPGGTPNTSGGSRR
jgi:hypothetical protein